MDGLLILAGNILRLPLWSYSKDNKKYSFCILTAEDLAYKFNNLHTVGISRASWLFGNELFEVPEPWDRTGVILVAHGVTTGVL